MVDSGTGRTEPPERRNSGRETRALAEADDREVRQPGAPLELVDAEAPEALVQVGGKRAGGAAFVLEHEHPDAGCLAIAQRAERDRAAAGGRCPEGRGHGLDVAARPGPQEGEGDMLLGGLHRSETAPGHAGPRVRLTSIVRLTSVVRLASITRPSRPSPRRLPTPSAHPTP